MGIFGCLKNHKWNFFHVSRPLQWYKKFGTYNKGSLQQAWASSFGKSTLDELKKKQWGFMVIGLEKWGGSAAEGIINERNFVIFQVHESSTKNTALAIMAQSLQAWASSVGKSTVAELKKKRKNGVLRS